MSAAWRVLACPGCGGDLALTALESDAGVCVEGVLSCAGCGGWYPVRSGVPRLLVPGPLRKDDSQFLSRWGSRLAHLNPAREATPTVAEAGQAQVQRGFGHKWTRQSWWGMEGNSAAVIDEWFLSRYGWTGTDEYRRFMVSRRSMLDAGCGIGREALRMAEASPAAVVYGLDVSEGVDEAARHARQRGLTNVLFVQGDLTRPPFRAASFDFVLSEGVLHHTPDTRQAFLALSRVVAPGGEIAFYVYRKKAPLREFTDDHVRRIVQDLPPDDAWGLMEPLTRLGEALSNLGVQVEVPEDVAVLGIKAGRYDIQRLIYYTMFKCYWNQRLTFDENVHVNFDWYYPRFAWRHTETEVEEWLREAGFAPVHRQVEEAGITMRATRT